DDSTPNIMADPTQIQQILFNLCVNARDAMPDGGCIHLTTKPVVLDQSFFSDQTQGEVGEYLLLEVRDEGEGIEPAHLERIFEPLFTTKAPGKGTGLGLATTHSITKQHGGFIDCSSTIGEGTCFTVYLPSVAEDLVESLNEECADAPQGKQEKILIAEDQDYVRQQVRRTLERLNYQVVETQDGEAAFAHYSEEPESFDAILLDVQMPKMDGIQCCRKIRAINPGAKIILTSGFIDDSLMHSLEEMGAFDFIQKPYDIRDLAFLIRQTIES
ncbi:MAG: response regulator, partial [Candidatus Omnitrophica bacterium]|nr:response regulator [Candidatus Omnitrophota bacterium]